MIREWNIVQVVFEVVDVECGPATVTALHPLDPLLRAGDRGIVFLASAGAAGAIHRHPDDRGVIEGGIVVVVLFEGQPPGRSPGWFTPQSPWRSSTCLGFSQSSPCLAAGNASLPASSIA